MFGEVGEALGRRLIVTLRGVLFVKEIEDLGRHLIVYLHGVLFGKVGEA